MKFKPFEIKANHPIRSPHENVDRIDSVDKDDYDFYNDRFIDALKTAEGDLQRHKQTAILAPLRLARFLQKLHGRGDPIKEIAARVVEAIEFTESTRKLYPDCNLIGDMVTPDRCGSMAICLLLATDEASLNRLVDLTQLTEGKRLYAFDILMRAFIPNWELSKKYDNRGKFIMLWSDSFTRAIASKDREASLARYLQNFQSYTKPFWPYKWKPWASYKPEINTDGSPKYLTSNHLFAFEVALAVCAYDLDDKDFRDHEYYPQELVDYYREHVRHTRDAWRVNGVGPDIIIELPSKKKKISLEKSKSKNFKRWLELVSDGDADAAKTVIAVCGNIKRMKDPQNIFEELSGSSIAICVDVKDDSTLEAELEQSIKDRDLVGYHTPDTNYEGGPGRCDELLKHATAWLKNTSYSLHVVDLRSDSWGAVLVHNDYADQFESLSKQLSIILVNN